VGHHPFIGGSEGAEAFGLHGRHQCLGLKASVTRVKRGRGCHYDQFMSCQVKRGKSRSSGLHGIGGRDGAAHMARVARRGGGGVRTGSGWRREGERDPQPVGRLIMLATRWVGLKAAGLKGQTGWRGGWARTGEKLFLK
jgi:hypothetical protein